MLEREQVLQQAMQLASQDRAFVADALEQSLNSGGFATPELAEGWAAEVERRIQAYDRGELPAAEIGPALNRVRQTLADFRARSLAS